MSFTAISTEATYLCSSSVLSSVGPTISKQWRRTAAMSLSLPTVLLCHVWVLVVSGTTMHHLSKLETLEPSLTLSLSACIHLLSPLSVSALPPLSFLCH